MLLESKLNYIRNEFNSYPSYTSITWVGAVYTLWKLLANQMACYNSWADLVVRT